MVHKKKENVVEKLYWNVFPGGSHGPYRRRAAPRRATAGVDSKTPKLFKIRICNLDTNLE